MSRPNIYPNLQSAVPGDRTRALLKEYGVDDETITEMKEGEVSWSIENASSREPETTPTVDSIRTAAMQAAARTSFTLVLFHKDGGHHVVGSLSQEQADKLIDVCQFERHQALPGHRPEAFPAGEVGNWVGIRPESDWSDLVASYRKCVALLSSQLSTEIAGPYLYLCRHTLELQLKAIIMLGQEALELTPDLPGHHDLIRLWTAAYPIANPISKDTDLNLVYGVVQAFHNADGRSVNFRYPVDKNNQNISHTAFVASFRAGEQVERFEQATAELNKIIRTLRFEILLVGLKWT